MTYTIYLPEPEQPDDPMPYDNLETGEKCEKCGGALLYGQRHFCAVCWRIFEEENRIAEDDYQQREQMRHGG